MYTVYTKMSRRLDILTDFSLCPDIWTKIHGGEPNAFSRARLCTVLTEVYDGAPEPSLVRENEVMMDRRIL